MLDGGQSFETKGTYYYWELWTMVEARWFCLRVHKNGCTLHALKPVLHTDILVPRLHCLVPLATQPIVRVSEGGCLCEYVMFNRTSQEWTLHRVPSPTPSLIHGERSSGLRS